MSHIKKDNTVKQNRYYCVLENPHTDYYDRKVIFGSSEEIVQRKIQKQLKKWGDVISQK